MGSKARLVITAVILEGRSPREVADAYKLSRSWVYELVARWRIEGDAAFDPRSRRPRTSPSKTPAAIVDRVLEVRRELTARGLDAGPDTIRWHLAQHHQLQLSRSTIRRVLVAAGVVTAEPRKRPRSSYIRFQADLPNECWQSDFTHYRLADRRDVEVLCWIDDHSRYALSVTAHHRVTGPAVLATFRAIVAAHGAPYSTLTDNGMVYTTRLAGGRGGRNGFEAELAALGIVQKNSRPNHPTTCGKVERFHQTLKRWLDAQAPPRTVPQLQELLDDFVDHYNHHRPHRSLARRTPATAYQARPKASPGGRDGHEHLRVRRDRVDHAGKATLRHGGTLYKIGIGRRHARTPILMLIVGLDIRIIHAETGELLRHLELNLHQRYQPTGNPPGHPKKPS